MPFSPRRFFDCWLASDPSVKRNSIEAYSSDQAAEIFCDMIHGHEKTFGEGDTVDVEVWCDENIKSSSFVVRTEIEVSFEAIQK